jgi:hypothetical protein
LHEIRALINDPILKIPVKIITFYVMNELLSALSYLSNTLQKININLALVIPRITTTKLHLNDIANQCEDT